MNVSRHGLWFSREGGSRLLPWGRLFMMVFLPPLLLFGAQILAVQYENSAFGNHLLLARDSGRLPGPQAARLSALGSELARELFWETNLVALDNLLWADVPPMRSTLPNLKIWLSEGSLQEMVRSKLYGDPRLRHDPGGDRPYFKGFYLDESGELQRCKAAFRGVSYWHQIPAKPSFRVKIKQEDLALGHRYVDLQRPEDVLAVKNHLSERMARAVGSMAGWSEAVRLTINGKSRGVYLRTYRAGEPLALMHGRLPGAFFKGDRFDGGEVWADAASWKTFGDVLPADLKFFDEFLPLLQDTNKLDWDELEARLDMQATARWAAVVVLAGSTHVDDRHNHMFFLSSYHGKLEPLIWDLNGYGLLDGPEVPVNRIVHRLQYILMMNPGWRHQRNLELHKLLTGVGSLESIKTWLDAYMVTAGPELKADLQLGELFAAFDRKKFAGVVPPSLLRVFVYRPFAASSVPTKYRDLLAWVEHRNRFLESHLADARVAVRGREVAVFGSVAVQVGERLLHPGLGAPKTDYGTWFPAAPRIYQLDFEPSSFKNAVTGAPVQPTAWPESAVAVDEVDRPMAGRLADLNLGPGVVRFTESLHVPENQTLRIQAGTTLQLAEGVGIYSRGPVLAMGTREQPIRLQGGCLGIAGSSTSGTRLRFFEAKGGHPGRWRGLGFKGQVSIYGCPDLVMEDCRFGANLKGDDSVNLANSKVEVRRCRWENSLADALDLDQVDGLVENCSFLNPGNDGLDMSNCRITVRDCRFVGTGDKGASVGEGTRVRMLDCEFERCAVGVQVKDSSRLHLVESQLSQSGTAVGAYRKKPYYRIGGEILMEKCRIENTVGRDFSISENSKLWLLDTPGVGLGAVRVDSPPQGWELGL